jgi:hypothetical protein
LKTHSSFRKRFSSVAPRLGARRFSHECAGSRSCQHQGDERLSEALPRPSLAGYKVQQVTDWMAEHVAEDFESLLASQLKQGLVSFTFIACSRAPLACHLHAITSICAWILRDDCSVKRRRVLWPLPSRLATPVPAISRSSSAGTPAFPRATTVGNVDFSR